MNVRRDEIVSGKKQQVSLDNPFMRWHQSFDTNSTHMDDWDDMVLKETDNFERAKRHQAKESDTVGINSVIPYEEDELAWDDAFGENPLNHAPDGNMPVIDHRIEEDQVWAFRTNWFNQTAVVNKYVTDSWSATQDSHVPFWTAKLTTPAYYSDEKFKKFEKQWSQRVGLELLKLKHAAEFKFEDRVQRRRHKHELQDYIQKVYDSQIEDSMQNVYVTDHKKEAEKYLTFSEEEDQHFYKVSQEFKNYKADSVAEPKYRKEKYERGSMKQKIFDPLAGARRNADGSFVLNIDDKEIEVLYDQVNRE